MKNKTISAQKAATHSIGFALGGIFGATGSFYIISREEGLINGFKAGLKKWRQESHSLTLKAKLLRFRNAISYGYHTAKLDAKERNHNYQLQHNPYYRKAYEQATKEGRKLKLSEKLKSTVKSIATTWTAAITEPIIEPIITQKTDYKKLMAELVKEQKKSR